MKKLIQPVQQPIKAQITIPGSKSITNRALLLAALSDGVCELKDILISDDTLAFAAALHQLGIMIQLDESNRSCIVAGCSGTFPNRNASLWFADAGTAARFLTTACASSPGNYSLNASQQLRNRPIQPLLKVLANQGVHFTPAVPVTFPFEMEGADGLQGGDIEIDSSLSGQFLSGLLMLSPFAKTPVTLRTQQLVSRSYVDMTCSMMADFGVLVRRIHQQCFSIPVPQRYTAKDYCIEPDFSTASYFFAAAAVTGGEVTIQAVNAKESKQGDATFLTILEKMGCHIQESSTGLTVRGPAALRGVSADMRECSDIFMTLAAIAPFAETPTSITNIGHTRHQESNRISAMREGLEKLNVKVEEGPDWLRIYPSQPKGAGINSHKDHRIAMAFSIIGLRIPGVEIYDAQCVSKTCPEFFTLWDSLYV